MSKWKVAAGFVLLFCGIFILGCTERNTISLGNTFDVMTSNITHVENPSTIDQANEGKLIHVTGTASTDEVLKDKAFLREYNTFCLARTISYYQWNEVEETEEYTKRKDGEEVKRTRTYIRHYKGWYDGPIDSSRFSEKGFDNVAPARLLNDTLYAEKVHLGAFMLSNDQVKQITEMEPAKLDYDQQFIEDIRYSSSKQFKRTVNVEIKNHEIYIGIGTMANPQIGDLKVTFTMAKSNDVTIVGKQKGDSIVPYEAGGNNVYKIQKGKTTAEQFLDKQQEENTAGTWGGRITGFLILVWGLVYIFPLIAKRTSALPVLADVARAGSFIISMALALIITLIIIGIAWVEENPIVSAFCFAIVIVAIVAIMLKGKKNKREDLTNQTFGVDEVDIP